MSLDSVVIDYGKVQNGSWMKLKQSEFLVAHAGKESFKLALSVKLNDQGYIGLYDLCEILADHIFLSWRSVKQPNGEDLDYTRELAIYALVSNAELRDFIEVRSQDLSYFQ